MRRAFYEKAITTLLIALLSIGISVGNSGTKTEESHSPSEEHHTQDAQHNQEAEEGFDPGHFIFHHIGDSYSWHIVGNFSIPLPVIVISKTKGLNVFMSTKFHHGQESFKGFSISHSEKNSGKVVEYMADGTEVRPMLDLSLTKNVLALIISLVIMVVVFLSISKKYKKNQNKAPKGMQNAFEIFILFIRDEVAIPAIGAKKAEKFMPFLLSIFFFIWINNMLGLLPTFPGGANITGNITITMTLAIFTFIITTFIGNKNYWLHIFNAPGVPWWLKIPIPLMPIIELLGIFIKPFVLMVRLFANITAGHIIALGFYSLIFIFGEMGIGFGFAVSPLSIAFTIFMLFLELLVAFIQAYVFTLLSALYFGMATEEHH